MTALAGGASAEELTLTPAALRQAAIALCDATAELHKCGLVHGDIAPQNVVVAPSGGAVLLDVLFASGGATNVSTLGVLNGRATTAESDCYRSIRVDPHGS